MNYFIKSRIIYIANFVFTKRSRIKRLFVSNIRFCNSANKMYRSSVAIFKVSKIKKIVHNEYVESVKR